MTMINNTEIMNMLCTELALNSNEIHMLSTNTEGSYLEIEFCCDGLRYDCYIDLEIGETVGINTEPLTEEEMLEAMYSNEILSSVMAIAA